jgi:threonine dehydratase
LAELVTLDEIRAARERIRDVARVTPVIEVPWPRPRSGATGEPQTSPRFVLKAENLQPMGAFKIRGACNMLAQLTPDALARGVITYSSGNHGQAVALAAERLGALAVIVMPTTAPAVKVEGAKSYRAEVLFAGTTSTERRARAEQEAAARGLTMVPPFDHPWIIAGQGTVGLEILEQCPDVSAIYVPVGGGGQLAGIAAAVKRLRPSVRVVAVEPEGAAKLKPALAAGAPVTLDRVGTIADGLMPVRMGDLTFAHARAFVDECVTVSDRQIADAVAWIFRHARLVAEPSGAAATAAVIAGLGGADGATGSVVAVLSGGNVAPEAFAKYVAAAG